MSVLSPPVSGRRAHRPSGLQAGEGRETDVLLEAPAAPAPPLEPGRNQDWQGISLCRATESVLICCSSQKTDTTSKAVVLNQDDSPENRWQRPETFVVVMTGQQGASGIRGWQQDCCSTPALPQAAPTDCSVGGPALGWGASEAFWQGRGRGGQVGGRLGAAVGRVGRSQEEGRPGEGHVSRGSGWGWTPAVSQT